MTHHANVRIRDKLDRGRFHEAADDCRKTLSKAGELSAAERLDVYGLMPWALLLSGKILEATRFAERDGSVMSQVCLNHIRSGRAKDENLSGLRWMEESLVFRERAVTANPEDKEAVALRDYARERKMWFTTHLETDKYKESALAGEEVLV